MSEPITLTKRLEAFIAGHKSRSCSIDIDDGYGATCWTCSIATEGKGVTSSEIAMVQERGDDADWPGLEPVIADAIRKAATDVLEFWTPRVTTKGHTLGCPCDDSECKRRERAVSTANAALEGL